VLRYRATCDDEKLSDAIHLAVYTKGGKPITLKHCD